MYTVGDWALREKAGVSICSAQKPNECGTSEPDCHYLGYLPIVSEGPPRTRLGRSDGKDSICRSGIQPLTMTIK